MTRKQFVERTARPGSFYMCNFAHNVEKSETDPSFALTGMQIFQASLTGQAVPQPAMLQYKFNGVSVDNISPIDNPNVDLFEGMQYAKSIQKDVSDKWKKVPEDVKNPKEVE